jgi:hypothetical protein
MLTKAQKAKAQAFSRAYIEKDVVPFRSSDWSHVRPLRPIHSPAPLRSPRETGNLSSRYNIAPFQAVLVARNSEWDD